MSNKKAGMLQDLIDTGDDGTVSSWVNRITDENGIPKHFAVLENMLDTMITDLSHLYNHKLVIKKIKPLNDPTEVSHEGSYFIAEKIPSGLFGLIPTYRGLFEVNFENSPYNDMGPTRPMDARYTDVKAEQIITKHLKTYAKLLETKPNLVKVAEIRLPNYFSI